MPLFESGENYLETILLLQKRTGNVHSVDIAAEMDFSKPSVSRAMGILKKNGYIIMEDDGRIVLTESGMEEATSVLDKHLTLTRFITENLNVPKEIAEKDACRIEHVISPETYQGIKNIMKKTGTYKKAKLE